MYIAIDFDGTCVTHEYPYIGKDVGAVPVLRKIVEAGHKIILHTMRAGKEAEEAENWFRDHQLPLFGINNNKTQWRWTKSKKVFAHLYIDDATLGAPLKIDPRLSERPFYDWEIAEKMLEDIGVIKKEEEK